MAYRNPYSESGRTGDEDGYRREALLRALDEEPPPPGRVPAPIDRNRERLPGPDGFVDLTEDPNAEIVRPYRTPPPAQETRDRLSGPGGRTNFATDPIGEVPDPYGPPATVNTAPPPPSTGAPYDPRRGYSLLDEYGDPYTRRMEGSPSVVGSAGTGASIGGSIVPGAGHVVGGLAGAIAALFAKNAASAQTDFSVEDARTIISQAHKDALGRDITPEYLDQILRGQGWESGDEWFGEAPLAYVLGQFYEHAAAERAQRGPEAAAAPAAGATPAAGGAGAPGGLPFEGFDFGAQDAGHERGNSAKYSYAAAVREAPPLTDTSKAGYEAWVRQHIAPRMEADGHRITAFEGDRFKVESASGSGWVDGLRGAGGDRPGFAWQPDSVGGVAGGGTISGTSGATSIQDAYAWLKQNADPSWTREQMQAAINAAFADVPGFVEGYAGDAVFDNGKLDLITNFEGPGASWSDNLNFVPLHGGGATAAGTGATIGGLNLANLAPGVQLAAPLGRSDVNQQIQEELQRILSGAPPRDALLAELGVV